MPEPEDVLGPHPPSVLIVDDDPDVRDVLVAQLARRIPGIRILTAGDAADALAQMGRTHVDLVLSDYHLPGVNGLDFLLQAKRAHPATRRAMLTGAPDDGLAVEASREAGIERFFVKPLDMTAFARAVEQMLPPRK